MSFNSPGLNGLNLDASVIMRPIGKLSLTGTVGTDLIIPENVSDSAKILKSDCEIKVNEIFSGNNSVTVQGCVFFTVLLLGEDGSLGSVKTSEEFELKDFFDGAEENSILIYSGNQINCSCRLINPRKLNLSSEISVNICAISERNAIPAIRGTETIEDEISLNRKYGNVNHVDTYSLCEKDIPVSHDIHLDGNSPPMSEMIYYNVRMLPSEILTTGNDVIAKSKAVFSCIYKSEEGNIFAIEKTFVLEKSVEADNADSFDWFEMTCVNDMTAEISIDGYGEAKLIELDFNYNILLNGVRNVTTQTVTDAYSTEYECETNVSHGESVIYKRTYGSSLSVNASVDRADIDAESVRSVMLGAVSVKNITSRYSDEKKRLIIEATASVSGVCEDNIKSEDDPEFSSFSFEYPFKCELDIGEKLDNTNWDIAIFVNDARFRCDQNKIYCDFENDIKVAVTETLPHSYLTEIFLDKNSPNSAPYAPITLCYPGGGESLWDIAKYYRVTTADIVASNNLESEDISNRKVLLIPSYRKQNPSYTKAN